MGAPFRTLCPGDGLEGDNAWLAVRAGEQAVEVAKLFAHIGLNAIDDLAGERHGRAYTDYKAHAVSLPVSETQVQLLLARFCLATRLNCLLGPLLTLGYFPTCPPHRGRPSSCLGGWLRWRRFCVQSHGRHPGPGLPRNALWRRPSWCGDDSTGPAYQLCGGSRAFHQRNRGSAGAAGHLTKRTSAGAGAHSSKIS